MQQVGDIWRRESKGMEVTVILKGGYSSISVDLLFRNLHSSRSWPKVRDFNPQKKGIRADGVGENHIIKF